MKQEHAALGPYHASVARQGEKNTDHDRIDEMQAVLSALVPAVEKLMQATEISARKQPRGLKHEFAHCRLPHGQEPRGRHR